MPGPLAFQSDPLCSRARRSFARSLCRPLLSYSLTSFYSPLFPLTSASEMAKVAETVSDAVSTASSKLSEMSAVVVEKAADGTAFGVNAISGAAAPKEAKEGEELLEFAIFAEPDEKTAAVFSSLIMDLAARHNAPLFNPHVTLWRAFLPIGTDPDVLIAEVDNAINEWRQVREVPELKFNLNGLEERRGSLVAVFDNHPTILYLHNLVKESVEGLVGHERFSFEPHLSLLHEENINDSIGQLLALKHHGGLADVEKQLEATDGWVAKKIYVCQKTEDLPPYAWDLLQEFELF